MTLHNQGDTRSYTSVLSGMHMLIQGQENKIKSSLIENDAVKRHSKSEVFKAASATGLVVLQ